MCSVISTKTRAPMRVLTMALIMVTVANALFAGEPVADPGTFGFEEFQWREVQDRDGKALGTVNDVLSEMPSGRIVFVLVKPHEPFAPATAVPAGLVLVPADKNAAVRLDTSNSEWLKAPHLDW